MRLSTFLNLGSVALFLIAFASGMLFVGCTNVAELHAAAVSHVKNNGGDIDSLICSRSNESVGIACQYAKATGGDVMTVSIECRPILFQDPACYLD